MQLGHYDESKVNLTLGGESFVDLTQSYENLLVIRSISEDLGMPGIPIGYIVGHSSTIKHIRKFADGSSIGMFHEIVAKNFLLWRITTKKPINCLIRKYLGCNAC